MDEPQRHPDFPDEGPSTHDEGDAIPAGIVEAEEWNGIGNEFTGVRFRKVRTANGERLQLNVPKRGYSILLDAMQLEIISAQRPEVFSELHARHLGSIRSETPTGSEGSVDADH